MVYLRPNVRRIWFLQNRRLIGFTMATFGITYGIGLVFTALMSSFLVNNLFDILLMWGMLFAVTLAAVILNIVQSHVSITNGMTEQEHAKHSGNVAVFFAAMAFGSVLFALPLVFAPAEASLFVLFSIGGIMLLAYILISGIFGHSYHELGFAALIIWAAFLASFLFILPNYGVNNTAFQWQSLVVSAMTLITVFSVTGIFMLHKASSEYLSLLNVSGREERGSAKSKKASRRRR